MIPTVLPLVRRARMLGLGFAAVAGLFVNVAAAHSVWIETVDGKLVVRFGEVGSDYEESPGYLDQLSLPKVAVPAPAAAGAATSATPEAVTVEKQKDAFLLKGAAVGAPAVISTIFPVMERPAKDGKPASARWPQFYARWAVVGVKEEAKDETKEEAKPVSVLDIVPAKEGGKATVYFKGKPLPEVKLTLVQPDGKEVELSADAEGVVKITPAGKGLYVLSVAGHSEEVSGTYEGKNYTVISHNSSLAWIE